MCRRCWGLWDGEPLQNPELESKRITVLHSGSGPTLLFVQVQRSLKDNCTCSFSRDARSQRLPGGFATQMPLRIQQLTPQCAAGQLYDTRDEQAEGKGMDGHTLQTKRDPGQGEWRPPVCSTCLQVLKPVTSHSLPRFFFSHTAPQSPPKTTKQRISVEELWAWLAQLPVDLPPLGQR